LSALRVSSLRRISVHKRHYDALTSKQQDERERALEAKRKLLEGYDLTYAAAASYIDPEAVILHLGGVIRIGTGGKVTVNKKDKISRGMIIYTDGLVLPIFVNNSDQATIIGEYFNAVQTYLNGDKEALSHFEGVTVIDEDGVVYELETDPEAIEEIEASREDQEFHKIYTGGT
jgi:hypothetical protein